MVARKTSLADLNADLDTPDKGTLDTPEHVSEQEPLEQAPAVIEVPFNENHSDSLRGRGDE